ncbi:phosphomannomutase [Herbihabitans rhizosphaerae]|uniref:Phosphomannomutase n=1 Tax=Herbihabitans rhizosphaerae TaxID=1872711 RepID=A0A4V2ES96_9PSEU|nr:phospho-sugar mutase [Herbihabitans rhizosphaerae]RZS36803.1 phosphomannomutase [Herbihabitans rhizosphaerae]
MTERLTSDLRDRTFRWIADDPDSAAQAELQQLLARAMGADPTAVTELADRMDGTLQFGTAGLRGKVRAGSNGMNTAVVATTTAGVVQWLRLKGNLTGTVVVGRDARHGSDRFAAEAAGVFAAAGFDVRTLSEPSPTPLLAFAVRHLGAVAGVQITASHNPPADNGYKLYDESGAQIVSPADREIEAAIGGAGAAVMVDRGGASTPVGDDLLEAYLSRVSLLAKGSTRTLRIAATTLHGVGAATLRAALERAGFTDTHLVAEQAEPDPDFSTVAFPNPEEHGATDLLLALAARVEADLAIALDPDADRCALGVPGPDGAWRMLRGDETGVLLGDRVLSTVDRLTQPDPLVATTIVSSSMLRSVAEKHGARYAETLTGFKNLVRAGDGLVYAYEEALGLCVDPASVRDKDGISAAVLACDLAAELKAAGRTVLDALDDLDVAHGVHLTGPVTVRTEEPGRLLARVRENPPSTVDGKPAAVEDLLPRTNGLRITTDGVRVVIRPSGTEPKLKAYVEVVEPVADADALAATRERAAARLSTVSGEIESLLV